MEIKENIFTENRRLTEVTGDISLVTELRIINISKKKKKRIPTKCTNDANSTIWFFILNKDILSD